MIKITPIHFYTQKIDRKIRPNFSSSQFDQKALGQKDISGILVQTPEPTWVKDGNLLEAINRLNHLKFDEGDIKYIQSLGVVLPFLSGEDAVNFIKTSHIGIKFGNLSSANTHARYDFDDNCIEINELYKNTQNPAEILAIAEAILHEAGHAKDKDGKSTLQEEIDCLSMNALSHRVFSKNFPNVFSGANSLIVKDGVCVYADLFFDENPLKLKLVSRLRQKYGDLPMGDFKHPPSNLALKAKEG